MSITQIQSGLDHTTGESPKKKEELEDSPKKEDDRVLVEELSPQPDLGTEEPQMPVPL